MTRLPEIGDVFDDRFRIERELGAGGFAQVYLARRGEQSVALKILTRSQPGYDRATVARAKREFEALQKVDSPLLVRAMESAISADGLLYLVFEYVPGIDLSDLLAHRGTLEPHEVARILRQVLSGLDVAHRAGVIHRDIKPQNIRVVDPEQLSIKVLDFGIARPTETGSASVTKTGELIGTPRYMSPEQLTNKPLSPASDIYSVGIMGVELLLGSDALQGASLAEQLGRLRTGRLLAVPESGAHPVWDAVGKMTERTPEDRFASCRQAVRAIDGPSASPKKVAPGDSRRPRRNLNLLLGLAGLAALIVFVLGLALHDSLPDEEQEVPSIPIETRSNPLAAPDLALVVEQTDAGEVDMRTTAVAHAAVPSPGCANRDRAGKPDHLKVFPGPVDEAPETPAPRVSPR